jgi:FkbM family methyltransferase
MTFISYAQNFEDVMLHRALRGVDRGFYIDVGAQHPINDSVTQAFYERGWRGINIDPVPQWADLLRTQRPHDINLQLALGAEGGHKQMFALADTGLSTDNEAFVQRHLDAGYEAESIEVNVSTLDEICDRHDVSTVHFLKIDVEGAEVDVISGFSFDRVRPWIVLVEAIEPVTASDSVSSVASYHSWEPVLLARGYEFVYDDGLNRFYLAHEKRELREHFVLPPNPLDGFMRYQEWIKHERIVQLDGELKKLFDARDLGASRAELQTLQEKWQIEQREHQDLIHDSANRLQRISMLEQETAALQAVDALRRAEFEALVSDSINRLERIAVL